MLIEFGLHMYETYKISPFLKDHIRLYKFCGMTKVHNDKKLQIKIQQNSHLTEMLTYCPLADA